MTGVDYVLYSNRTPLEIEETFISKIKEKWTEPLIDEFERMDTLIELFFSKNSSMDAFFDEYGYALDENGEGCFMFAATKMPKFIADIKVIDIFHPESRKNSIEHESTVMLTDIWEYTLVLPSTLEDSDFSNEMYQCLKNLIC